MRIVRGTTSWAAMDGRWLVEDSKTKLRASMTGEADKWAERFAEERRLASEERRLGRGCVLFLCGHNAGRSQMSAALYNRGANARRHPMPMGFSAGSKPGSHVNAVAVEAMREIGVDMSSAFPKPWTSEVGGAASLIITMGCGDQCPIQEGVECRDWKLPDPHGQGIQAVRAVRDEIASLVEDLLRELDGRYAQRGTTLPQ